MEVSLPAPLLKNVVQVGNSLLLPLLEHQMVNLGGPDENQVHVEQALPDGPDRIVDGLKGWRLASRKESWGHSDPLLSDLLSAFEQTYHQANAQ
jgi:hypothetical protein